MTNARELTSRLADLLRREQVAMAEFLVALADFDRARLWIDLGYTSLFYFLHRELGLSKGAAQYRKTAAELIQKVPAVVEPLRDGRLCLTSIVEAARVVTPDNHDEMLPRFFHLSRREAMEVVAEVHPDPAPPSRTVVTSAPAAARFPAAAMGSARAALPLIVEAATCNAEPMSAMPATGWPGEPLDANSGTQPQQERSEVQPLTAALRRLHVTVSREFLAKLAAARDALTHSHPGASDEEILAAGLDLLLSRDAKRKGLVARPQTKLRASNPQRVPARVRRAVWQRDGGCCSWRLDSGGVCGSTRRLQLDHVTPLALGGTSTVENVRLLCATHNVLAARRVYGDACMSRYTRRGSKTATTDLSASPAESAASGP
jgi:5-methylcytosine-specific restriction endonuclease McrA